MSFFNAHTQCRTTWLTATLGLVMAGGLLTSCGKKVVPAPPIAPAPVLLPASEPAKPPPTLPSAPKLEPAPAKEPAVTVEVKPPPPPPPATKPPRRTNRRRATETKVETPKPEPVENAQAPAPPKLEQLLTPEQTVAFSSRLSASLERVRGSLVAIQAKSLSAEQKEVVTRIKAFITQAEQTREQDLVSAVNLAERADVLSRDLLERLR